ncbi:hypothetical protein D3C71_539460 [compost metagenome]
MARGGNITFTVDYREFEKRLQLALSRVERGTKKATIRACEQIKDIALPQVPSETGALANSFFYEIQGSYRNFTGKVGFGGPKDVRNPKTGQMVSEYMIAVHEDLQAVHPVGNAKFLENAVREYQQKFLATVAEEIRSTLS